MQLSQNLGTEVCFDSFGFTLKCLALFPICKNNSENNLKKKWPMASQVVLVKEASKEVANNNEKTCF